MRNPAAYDSDALGKLSKIVGHPVGHVIAGGKPDVPADYFEKAEPTSKLDDSMTWYWPGLVYMAIGLDRSIFAMFMDGLRKRFIVKTHTSADPIVGFAGADKATNPWSGTLQGIPTEHADAFDGYIASYSFTRPGKVWRVRPTVTRIADPFYKQACRGVNCTLLLPELPEQGRRVSVTQPAGLLLRTPMLGITHDAE